MTMVNMVDEVITHVQNLALVQNQALVMHAVTPQTGSGFVIETEQAGDDGGEAAREALLDRVMGEGRRRKSSEKLRHNRLPADGLVLVARDHQGSLLATVRLWNIHAGQYPDGSAVDALLLGPLAVECAMAGLGIGAALMREAISRARELGHGAIILVGDPQYYCRFGFDADKTHALSMPGPVERYRFLALELQPEYLKNAQGMLIASGIELKPVMTAVNMTA